MSGRGNAAPVGSCGQILKVTNDKLAFPILKNQEVNKHTSKTSILEVSSSLGSLHTLSVPTQPSRQMRKLMIATPDPSNPKGHDSKTLLILNHEGREFPVQLVFNQSKCHRTVGANRLRLRE